MKTLPNSPLCQQRLRLEVVRIDAHLPGQRERDAARVHRLHDPVGLLHRQRDRLLERRSPCPPRRPARPGRRASRSSAAMTTARCLGRPAAPARTARLNLEVLARPGQPARRSWSHPAPRARPGPAAAATGRSTSRRARGRNPECRCSTSSLCREDGHALLDLVGAADALQ